MEGEAMGKRWGEDKQDAGWGRCVCGAPLVWLPNVLACARTSGTPLTCAQGEGARGQETAGWFMEDVERWARDVRRVWREGVARLEQGADPREGVDRWALGEALEALAEARELAGGLDASEAVGASA